jgi:DNA invertase Pin-like site-specific DNA recombinase
VAAYIRVSTDAADQENSFETQERYFNQMLLKYPECVSAGIYSDYGISGTSGEKRTGFKRILRHCMEGKIDRIVCKSISRFSRNTADFMTALRILREYHVTILFEKEALDTSDPTSEFILTTLGAIAQEESRSISGNINWSNRKRFPKGEVRNQQLYGYRYNGRMIITESGYRYRDIEIVEEEAEVVRRIFTEAAAGTLYADIARGLNRDGVAPPESAYTKKRKEQSVKGQLKSHLDEGWTARHISQILQKERYVGDVRIQKTYTVDYLTHQVRKNNGEVEQYLVRDHHPAIVSRELYEEVQKVIALNAQCYGARGKNRQMRIFSGRLICAECGRFYNVRNTRSHPIWFCPSASRNNGKVICHAEKVYEEQIVRMLRVAILERFHLTTANVTDCVMETGDFVKQMYSRLENVQRLDYVERDRAFYKRRIAAIGKSGEDARKQGLTDHEAEKDQLVRRLDYLERYWEELEADVVRREAAIEWIKTLSTAHEGTDELLNGMSGKYFKAFVLSVTIHSPLRYTVHWFDDTRTEVELDTNIEDFRYTKV